MNVETCDVQMDDTGLHIVQHLSGFIVTDKVLHDGWWNGRELVA